MLFKIINNGNNTEITLNAGVGELKIHNFIEFFIREYKLILVYIWIYIIYFVLLFIFSFKIFCPVFL